MCCGVGERCPHLLAFFGFHLLGVSGPTRHVLQGDCRQPVLFTYLKRPFLGLLCSWNWGPLLHVAWRGALCLFLKGPCNGRPSTEHTSQECWFRRNLPWHHEQSQFLECHNPHLPGCWCPGKMYTFDGMYALFPLLSFFNVDPIVSTFWAL